MKTLLLTMAILSLCACEGGSGGGSGAATIVPKNQIKIHVYGDEISYGTGVTTSYVDLIKARTGYTIVNHSKAASMLGGAYTTYNNVFLNADLNSVTSSDIVIIFAGIQDVRWYGTINQTLFNTMTSSFYGLAYTTGAKVYVVNPIKMNAGVYASFSPLNNGSDVKMASYGTMLQTLANSYNFVYIDMNSTFSPTPANLQGDLQWPNETGHQVIANKILTSMGF